MNKISLKSAAEQLNVSVVSIHNWIKDGSLKTIDGSLTQECLDDFKRDFLNENKLSLEDILNGCYATMKDDTDESNYWRPHQ